MARAQALCCHFDCGCQWQVAPFVRRSLRFPLWNSHNNTNPKNLRVGSVKVQADMMLTSDNKIPHVLTVAGSDSGAGAGIQADLKACAARRVYCSTVITAVTAQNTVGVQGVDIVPEDFVAEQLQSVLSDMHVDVVKTGMLPSLNIVKVLCQSLRKFPIKGSSCG
ncbi:Thiamine biosynthetic bifunctional enzyme TH1 [Spatholobus suberectus]|nr:Thiamine biosynthetic bifunctional enzyme TH1 [Spatholobus suberectus]